MIERKLSQQENFGVVFFEVMVLFMLGRTECSLLECVSYLLLTQPGLGYKVRYIVNFQFSSCILSKT